MAIAEDATPAYRSPIHFKPSRRKVGDVMPFYWKGQYHVFYLTNPTGNHDVHWEHCVSRDLIRWKQLPPALAPDPKDPKGPDGCCIFTGCVVEKDGVFHAWYTSWNPANPEGREFLSHATSSDLVVWQKHPEHRIAPDGLHFADHQARDFRDPQIFKDEASGGYRMHILANVPGKQGAFFGLLTSDDLVNWKQVGTVDGVPGDECPDYFRIGDTHYIHGCRRYCYADSQDGPYRYPELTNQLDMPCIRAAKRVWNGRRHIWFGGWHPSGVMPMPREVYAGPNGLLYMKPAREIADIFNNQIVDLTDFPQLEITGSQWKNEGIRFRAEGKRDGQLVLEAPDNYLLDCLVELTPESNFTIAFRVRENEDEAWRLTLSPGKGQLAITGPGINHTRPCPVDTSKPVKIEAYVQGDVIECFVNDQFAQTCDARHHTSGGLGLSLDGGAVKITRLQIRQHE